MWGMGSVLETPDMARPLRIEFPGALYHVTSRGDRREAMYEDEEERATFLGVLAEVVERYNWVCHAYCLMTNHYHLLIETVDGNLSKGMRQLNGIYTQASNRRHHRVGHLYPGPLQRHPGRQGCRSAGAEPIRRAQPRTCRYRQPPGRLALEQLPANDGLKRKPEMVGS